MLFWYDVRGGVQRRPRAAAASGGGQRRRPGRGGQAGARRGPGPADRRGLWRRVVAEKDGRGTGGGDMGRRRAALALLGVLALPLLVACSGAPTPLCRQAAALADGHHLTAALSRYVDAQRADEGTCATDGQHDVQDAQAKVGLVLARAASAERHGSVTEAEDLYVQALTQDVDNEQARTAVGRLQAVTTATPPTAARPAASAPGDGGADPVIVILVTVVLLVALATGVIAALARQRDRPRIIRPAALPWLGPADDDLARLERLESRVGFLTEALEQLAAAAPVPAVRVEYVPPGPGPDDEDRTTTVSAVTVVRLPRPDALLVVCRRLVHDAQRPADELLADVDRLGTAEAPHLEILLEEAAIAAATRGLLDPAWRVVEKAWEVEGTAAADVAARQVAELLVGRPVVLPEEAVELPEPLGTMASAVATQVETPGHELAGGATVLLHATSAAARPPTGASVLLTAAVRSLRFDPTAHALLTGLRDPLWRSQEAVREAAEADGEAPSASTSSTPVTRRSLRSSPAGTGSASS
jgi:hypothetical protein